jgi:hypothetical protein
MTVSEMEEICEYYLNVMFNAQSILIGIKSSSLFAVIFTITGYIPLEQPLFYAQQFCRNTNFIMVSIQVLCVSFTLWFFILGLSVLWFRLYYETVRLSEYAPMGLLWGYFFIFTVFHYRSFWWMGWDEIHGGRWFFPFPFWTILLKYVILISVGCIILRTLKKAIFYSLLTACIFVLSSFYLVFSIFIKIISAEKLSLRYEIANYMVNGNLLGFLIWYIIFAYAFWIYLKKMFPDELSIGGFTYI